MNLERLDLSGNNILNLASLASLRLLSVLNLSANRISNLGKIVRVIDFVSIHTFIKEASTINEIYIYIFCLT